MKGTRCLRWAGSVLAVGVTLLIPAPLCCASLISFDIAEPVILSTDGTLFYDAATGNFHKEAIPLTYNSSAVPGGFVFFSGAGLSTVDLFVDSAGNFVSNGSGVDLTGAIDFDSDGIDDVSGTLLTGSIFAFGAEPPGPPTLDFNGLFTIDGGQLTTTFALSGGGTMFGGFPVGGMPGGFFVFAENVTSGTLGDFTADFSSDSVKELDVNTVPEPTTLSIWLLTTAAGITFGRMRRRRDHRCELAAAERV